MRTIISFLGLIIFVLTLSTSTNTYAQGRILKDSLNLLDGPESVVFDALYNRYLVSNWNNGDIIQIDSTGAQSYFNPMLHHVAGLHIKDSVLYAASNNGTLNGVVAFNLSTGDTVAWIKVPGMQMLNDITTDSSGYLYVTDYYRNRINKINLNTHKSSIFVNTGLQTPNGIVFDQSQNRLLVMNEGAPGGPILEVNLVDSTTTVLVNTGVGGGDGISFDKDLNVYFSSWSSGCVYRYDPDLSLPKEIISSGHDNPADIFVNVQDNILAIPNLDGNSVDFIPLFPLQVPHQGQESVSLQDVQFAPNPFRYETILSCKLTTAKRVIVRIVSLAGTDVTILEDSYKEPGLYKIRWDGMDKEGRSVSEGIYLCIITAGNETHLKKIIYISK